MSFPWPSADTWPVARLRVPALGVDTIVLADVSSRTLAFGPGHYPGTPLAGRERNSVLAGQRDSHFRFLRDLRPGGDIWVETPNGKRLVYRVVASRVVGEQETWVLRPVAGRRLTLVTCYPFDALQPGGSLRYVVIAEERSGGTSGA